MQAVIMAGGKGTRLTALTKDVIPKPMVKLLDKPLLEWQIECLRRNGIDDIIMIIGHLGEIIQNYFGDGSRWGEKIRYYTEKEPLGTAGALPKIRDMLADEFFLLFGDLLLDVDFGRMSAFHREKRAIATLFAHPNSHPFDSDLIVADEHGQVKRFDSKHNDRSGRWYDNCVNAGLYVMDKKILEHIPDGRKVDLEKEVLSPLCERNAPIYAYTSPEYVKDIGTVERIRAAEQDLKNEHVAARNLSHKQRAIFMDRDGTLNVLNGLVYQPEQLELEACAVEALRLINRSGYLAILVTNQPVVARGLCDIEDVERIHRKLQTLLGREGVYLDGIEFCPHHPDKGYHEENPDYKIPCHCRKPDIGMLEICAERFNIDLSQSWMVGDTTVDIKTGRNAGCKTALVLTGEAGLDGKFDVEADLTAADLAEAVKEILSKRGQRMKDYTNEIHTYLEHEIATLRALDINAINSALNLLLETFEGGNTVFVFGNGGSSATASHYQSDFNKSVSEHTEKKFNFQCLNDNVATVMAVANDIGFEEVFRFQLVGHIKPGDLVMAISGSGNSKNVINAVEYAKEQGAKVIGLTGFDGGRLRELSDISLNVPVNSMQITEDVHMVFDHLMMSIFYRDLAGIEHLK